MAFAQATSGEGQATASPGQWPTGGRLVGNRAGLLGGQDCYRKGSALLLLSKLGVAILLDSPTTAKTARQTQGGRVGFS